MMTPSQRIRRPISPPTCSWTTRSLASMVGGRPADGASYPIWRPPSPVQPGGGAASVLVSPCATPMRFCSAHAPRCGRGRRLAIQAKALSCRLSWCGASISPARVHVRSAALGTSVARRRQAAAGRTGRERSDVKRLARRLCLSATMVAGAAALILPSTRAGGPRGPGSRGGPRGRLHGQPHLEHDARPTAATPSPSPRPTSPIWTASRPSWSATAPGRSTPTTSATARASPAGPTTPAHRSTPRRRWLPFRPTAPTRSSSATAARPHPTSGGYQAITNTGGDQWFVQETNPGTDPTPHSAVAASLTVGSYAGGYGVEAGSLGQNTYAARRRQRRHAGRVPVVPGGLGVLDRCRRRPLRRRQQRADQRWRLECRPGLQHELHERWRTSASCRARATPGQPEPNGGLICQYNINQNIDRSSPAVGQFLAGGAVGIVIGDGSFYSGASDSNKVFAINTGCGLAWSDAAQRRHG